MTLTRIRQVIEYFAGERDIVAIDAPLRFLTGRYEWVFRCLVWIAALALIYAFSGQSSKFIYIDF